MRYLLLWIGFGILLAVLHVGSADAASCTPGTDCYGDCVRGPATIGAFKNAACQTKYGVGVPVDTTLIFVEDFEAPTMRNNQGVGNGAPYYGPWYDDGVGNTGSGGVCNRGDNSYWNRTYGNGVEGVIWQSGQPTTLTLGCRCAGFSFCTGMKVWDATNRWGANSHVPPVAIMSQSTDFNAEVATINPPTGASGGGSGVFDGNASLGWRVQTGLGNTNGIIGSKSFSGTRTFGITQVIAYANNVDSSGVMSDSWKHNEWGPGTNGLFLFQNLNTELAVMPFKGFIFFKDPSQTIGTETQTSCDAHLAAATRSVGQFQCFDVILVYATTTSVYSRNTDFPLGTWGCAEGFFENLGLINTRIRIWFTGPAGVRKLVIDISNLDTRGFGSLNMNPAGVSSFDWDGYSNQAGNVGLSQTTFRYEDNIHVRNGSPVPCSQIGYAASAGPPQPNPPTLLRFADLFGQLWARLTGWLWPAVA